MQQGRAAPNLQIAIATLPAIAAMMTRSEPECSATVPPPLRRRYVIIITRAGRCRRSLLGASPLRRERSYAGQIGELSAQSKYALGDLR